jgi:hypothetical protein
VLPADGPWFVVCHWWFYLFERAVRGSGRTVRGKGADSPRYPAGLSARPIADGPPCLAGRSARGCALCVGDSPRGPLKQLGNPHLKPATKPKHALLNHAGHGPCHKGPSGPPGGPLEDPLEQTSPRSRMRAPLGQAPSRSKGCASLERAPLRSRACSPLERGPPCSRARSALERGLPRLRAPRTRAPAPVHGHLMP